MSEAVKDWLRTKHVTLWADWDITDEKDLVKAAAWFLTEMRDFQHYLLTNSAKAIELLIEAGAWPPPKGQS